MSIYAVNSKEPIAAWIPSLDTAGNGTTTLTDLVGANNGTLTNMDPASDWVLSDEKYALDFDGLNDDVLVPHQADLNLGNIFTLSVHVRSTVSGGTRAVLDKGPNGYEIAIVSNVFVFAKNTVAIIASATVPIVIGQWHHLCVTKNGTITKLYQDGVDVTGGVTDQTIGGPVTPFLIGRDHYGNHFGGEIDDIRLFAVTGNQSDVDYLFNSGDGRGRVLSGESRRRRQSVFGGAL